MSGVHDRLPLPYMLAPGRKTREIHERITREIHRLSDREDQMTDLAQTSAQPFVRELAAEHAQRISARRDLLLRGGFRRKRP